MANTFVLTAGLPVAKARSQSSTSGVNTAYITAGLPPAVERTTTITTSIISGGKSAENVTISNVAWTDDAGWITLSAAVPAGVNVGDTITDSASNSYLITAINGSILTCQDFDSTTDPATGSATIQEAYQTIAAWAADINDTTLYQSGDDAVGECYADASFSIGSRVLFESTVCDTCLLTAPVGERHDGTVGTGATLLCTSTISQMVNPTQSCDCSWLTFDGDGNGKAGIYNGSTIDRCIFCDVGGTVNTLVIAAQATQRATNNIAYSIWNAATGTGSVYGIGGGSCDDIHNNTVFNVSLTSGTATSDAYGFTFSDSTGVSATNNIGCDVTTAGSGSAVCCSQSSPVNATTATNATSDATSPDGASYQNWTTADQFVSTGSGSEDLHLKADSDAIRAGTDLGTTPTGVNLDIDGYDRDAGADDWDIGADSYKPQRSTTVTTSIMKTGKSISFTATAMRWNGTTGIISLGSWPFADYNVGDLINDGTNNYLITSLNGGGPYSWGMFTYGFEVQAFDSTDPPTIGSCTITEGYNEISEWEADLSDAVLYLSGDTAQGECYNDGVFNLSANVVIGTAISLANVILTVPDGERHDGSEGTGARVSQSTNTRAFGIAQSPMEFSWLECDWNGLNTASVRYPHYYIINIDTNTLASTVTVANMILHGARYSAETNMGGIGLMDGKLIAINNAIYDMEASRNPSNTGCIAVGVYAQTGRTNKFQYYNNTVYGMTVTYAGTGKGVAFAGPDTTDCVVKNCLGLDSLEFDFSTGLQSPTNTTVDYNESSDATAAGANSVTNATAADELVSTTSGSEDLHLKSGADAIDAGTDLGTTPTGVNIDINGRDRDAEGDTWDIGAHEYVPSEEEVTIIHNTILSIINKSQIFNSKLIGIK